jgi:hypothetical protein
LNAKAASHADNRPTPRSSAPTKNVRFMDRH